MERSDVDGAQGRIDFLTRRLAECEKERDRIEAALGKLVKASKAWIAPHGATPYPEWTLARQIIEDGSGFNYLLECEEALRTTEAALERCEQEKARYREERDNLIYLGRAELGHGRWRNDLPDLLTYIEQIEGRETLEP